MSLLEQAKKDLEFINGNVNEFSTPQVWLSPASLTVTINGRHVKHHLGIDENGAAVNTKTASCTFSEKAMIDVNYPIRDASGEVSLKGHFVTINDSTGNPYKYKVNEWFPDETLGQIVCMLSAST